MKQQKRIHPSILIGGAFFLAFVILTALLRTVDLAVHPSTGTGIGFSALNKAVFEAIGTNEVAYGISEVLGILALTVPFIFAVLALAEWIKRKRITRIDRDLFVLFAVYAITVICYLFFEFVVINHRPILVDGGAEASYPSSHTLLAVVIFGTACLQVWKRVSKPQIKIPLLCLAVLFLVTIPVFRLISGVHWVTDIFAAVLLGAALVFLYHGVEASLSKASD